MKKIEDIIKNTNEKNQNKVDWTKVWSNKYPILKEYQKEVNIPYYSKKIREMLISLQNEYGYNELDSMLVLKDILAHEYMDKKN